MICKGAQRGFTELFIKVGIIVDSPSLDHASDIIQSSEDMSAKPPMEQAPIGARDEGILDGFAGRDVVPPELEVLDVFEDSMPCELGAIVRDKELGLATAHNQFVEFEFKVQPAKRDIEQNTLTLCVKSSIMHAVLMWRL